MNFLHKNASKGFVGELEDEGVIIKKRKVPKKKRIIIKPKKKIKKKNDNLAYNFDAF